MKKVSFNRLTVVLSHLFNGFALVLILFYSLWFTSDGRLTSFHAYENYYINLSRAFAKGSISLLDVPDPRLANISDPHQAAGTNIPFLWDLSYFRGKYYLYFGPTPVMFYLVYLAISRSPAPAPLGVLAAYAGIALLLFAIFYLLRQKFYSHAPFFSIGIFLLAACINPAYAFLLSRPLTYETAILAGQLFLLAGLFFWLLYLITSRNRLLLLCGLCWGLAVLARYDNVISVGVYASVAILVFWFSRPADRAVGQEFAAHNTYLLIFPLALSALALLIYNTARFGNPLQTGLQYQLTTPVTQYYSGHFILTNLYVYLFYPNPVLSHFPFITLHHFIPRELPAWAAAHLGKQFDFGFFGLFSSIPLFWLEGLAALALLARFVIWPIVSRPRTANATGLVPVTGQGSLQNRYPAALAVFPLPAMMLLAGLLQLLFLLFYYYSAVRFLGDFYLPLLAGGFLINWELDRTLIRKNWLRWIFWALMVFLILQTVLIGFFSGFTLFPYYFMHHNPALYQVLSMQTAHYQNVIHAILKPASLPGQ